MEQVLGESIIDLDKFYEINWKHHLPRIFVIDDRKTINLLKGESTADWIIGWSEGKTIYALNRHNLEKESNHKYDEQIYKAFLKHEISHAFYNILSAGVRNPVWLNEGVAIYTSGQNEFKKRPQEFKTFLEFYDKGGESVYDESGFFVQFLVEKFGKTKLLSFVKTLRTIKNREEFEKAFAKEYGFDLAYQVINSEVKNLPSISLQ